MKLFCFLLLSLLFTNTSIASESHQIKAVRTIIDAVNLKQPKLYVSVFAEKVQIFLEHRLKVDGKKALLANRTEHFSQHPRAKSVIQYLVEIDNKVIMHDQVWLDRDIDNPQDIVEVYTFEDGLIVRVDVVQPNDLFEQPNN